MFIKRKTKFYFLSLILIYSNVITCNAKSKNASTPERLEHIFESIRRPMIECFDRIWPGLDYTNIPVIMVDSKKKKAYNWGEEISYDKLPVNAKFGMYTSLKWNDVPAMSISLNHTFEQNWGGLNRDIAVTLALHEGFHFFAQKNWPAMNLDGFGRGVEYPAIWQFRYYRLKILRNLKKAYLTGKNIYLHYARFWSFLFNTQYKKYRDNYFITDLLEGTASYAEYMSSSIAIHGCHIEQKVLHNYLKSKLNEVIAPDENSDKDLEQMLFGYDHYAIGAVAGFILDEKNYLNWNNNLAFGELTPSEYLLNKFYPLEEEEELTNPLIINVKKIVNKINKKFSIKVDPFLKQISSNKFARIFLPKKPWVAGGFRLSHFVNPLKYPNIHLYTNIFYHSETGQSESYFNIKDGVQYSIEGSNPCNNEDLDHFITLVDKNNVIYDDTSISFKNEIIDFKIVNSDFKEEVDQQGNLWYCLNN